MTKNNSYGKAPIGLGALAGLLGMLLLAGTASAIETKGVSVKPHKAPPKAVTSAPVCSPDLHPKIAKVAPDEVKPGMKIAIKGNNFGKKECFKDVSFGSVAIKDFKVVNDSLVEATVPAGLKPGMMKVYIQTAGGTADNTVLVRVK